MCLFRVYVSIHLTRSGISVLRVRLFSRYSSPILDENNPSHGLSPHLDRLSFVIADGNLLSVYGRLELHLASPPLYAPDIRLCAD